MSQAIPSISSVNPSTGAEQQASVPFLELPTDMIQEILMHSDIATIGALRQTCRQMEVLLQDDGIWRKLFRRDFPKSLPPFPGFRDSFVHRHRFHTNFTHAAFTTKEFRGGRNFIYSLVVAGTRLIAGYNGIDIYDLPTGQRSVHIPGEGYPIYSLLVSNDLLFSGTSGNTINVYRLTTGYFVTTLTGHRQSVTCLGAYGSNLISGSLDSTIRIWNVDTGESQCLEGHEGVVTSLVVAPNGVLYSGSRDKTIRAWDLKERKFLYTLREHEHVVNGLVLDGENLISASYDRSIKFWDLKERRCLHTLLDTKPVIRMTSREGKMVTSCDGQDLRFWNLEGCLEVLIAPLRFQALTFQEDKLFAAGDKIVIFDFQAKDSEIFAEIAKEFKTPKSQEAALRFFRMPKKAIKKIQEKLHQIMDHKDSMGPPDETFLELRWNYAPPEKKAEAIEAYLAEENGEKK